MRLRNSVLSLSVFFLLLAIVSLMFLSGCSSSSSSPAPQPISVSITNKITTIAAGAAAVTLNPASRTTPRARA